MVRDVVLGEQVELEDARAGDERSHDIKRRVLRRRADERDGAVLDVGQHVVLLRAVEAVQLVDEEDGLDAARRAPLPRVGDHAPDVRDPGVDGREGLEVALRAPRDDGGERGLAGAGRPPQHERGRLVALDHPAQRAPRADDLLLPHEVVEVPGALARGERGGAARRVADRALGEARLIAAEEVALEPGRRVAAPSRLPAGGGHGGV